MPITLIPEGLYLQPQGFKGIMGIFRPTPLSTKMSLIPTEYFKNWGLTFSNTAEYNYKEHFYLTYKTSSK